MTNLTGSGIYSIKSPCGRVYIGKSGSVSERVKHHLSTLASGTHHNSGLQAAWAAFGGEGFVVELIENAKPCELSRQECYWVEQFDALNPEKGFNLAGISVSGSMGFPCEVMEVGEWIVYRRLSDGYWNATALCDQFGKRFDNWTRLQDDAEILSLVDSGCHGSWMHPDLVMLIARWLSCSFYFAYMNSLRAIAANGSRDLDGAIVRAINAAL